MNSVEWSHAQDLLVKLVQILSPLTVRAVPSSLFLHRRFFIPPSVMQEDSFLNKHPIRLLKTLHAVQKQVDEWIEESLPPKSVQREEPQVDSPWTKALPREEQAVFPLPDLQDVQKEPLKTEPLSQPPKEKEKEMPMKEPPPLKAQVKILIHQVQDAIVTLSTSAFIQDPQEAPLREALKKLKPNLDRIIETIAETQENESPQPLSSFRRSIPTASREEFVKKWSPSLQILEKPILPLLPKREKQEFREKRNEETSKRGVKKEIFFEESVAASVSTATGPYEGEREESPPFKPTVLPAAPFTPETRQVVSSRKKKRKGFWFKEKEDPRDS